MAVELHNVVESEQHEASLLAPQSELGGKSLTKMLKCTYLCKLWHD